MLRLADHYPLTLRTERDFFPAVTAYLAGRVPTLGREVAGKEGVVDFRIGGNNPVLIELAVAPRALIDPHDPSVVFPGHRHKSQLYAVANGPELRKLSAGKQAKARYLILLDLRGGHDAATLRASYEAALPKGGGNAAVTIVYVAKDRQPLVFGVGGAKKGRRTMHSRDDG